MNLSQNILHNAISPSIISPQNQIGGKIAQVPQIANIQNIQPNNQVHHIIQQHVNFGTQNVGSIPIIGSGYVYNPNISIQTLNPNPT